MDKDKILQIVVKLINDTKDGTLVWQRISMHEDYCDDKSSDQSFLFLYIKTYIESAMFSDLRIDTLNSYFTSINKGFFYLFRFKDNYERSEVSDMYDLAFQSNSHAKVQSFKVDTKDILRINNIIETYIDNNEGFLSSFLAD